MKLDFIKDISSEAREWASFFFKKHEEKSEKEQKALHSLILALKEPIKYIGEIKQDPGKKSLERDDQLSLMWSETSMKVRPYKPALAEKCFFKGLYWADQTRFSSEEIGQLGISISDMEKEVSDAIKNV